MGSWLALPAPMWALLDHTPCCGFLGSHHGRPDQSPVHTVHPHPQLPCSRRAGPRERTSYNQRKGRSHAQTAVRPHDLRPKEVSGPYHPASTLGLLLPCRWSTGTRCAPESQTVLMSGSLQKANTQLSRLKKNNKPKRGSIFLLVTQFRRCSS